MAAVAWSSLAAGVSHIRSRGARGIVLGVPSHLGFRLCSRFRSHFRGRSDLGRRLRHEQQEVRWKPGGLESSSSLLGLGPLNDEAVRALRFWLHWNLKNVTCEM